MFSPVIASKLAFIYGDLQSNAIRRYKAVPDIFHMLLKFAAELIWRWTFKIKVRGKCYWMVGFPIIQASLFQTGWCAVFKCMFYKSRIPSFPTHVLHHLNPAFRHIAFSTLFLLISVALSRFSGIDRADTGWTLYLASWWRRPIIKAMVRAWSIHHHHFIMPCGRVSNQLKQLRFCPQPVSLFLAKWVVRC